MVARISSSLKINFFGRICRQWPGRISRRPQINLDPNRPVFPCRFGAQPSPPDKIQYPSVIRMHGYAKGPNMVGQRMLCEM